jgi:hypothetical protein
MRIILIINTIFYIVKINMSKFYEFKAKTISGKEISMKEYE